MDQIERNSRAARRRQRRAYAQAAEFTIELLDDFPTIHSRHHHIGNDRRCDPSDHPAGFAAAISDLWREIAWTRDIRAPPNGRVHGDCDSLSPSEAREYSRATASIHTNRRLLRGVRPPDCTCKFARGGKEGGVRVRVLRCAATSQAIHNRALHRSTLNRRVNSSTHGRDATLTRSVLFNVGHGVASVWSTDYLCSSHSI